MNKTFWSSKELEILQSWTGTTRELSILLNRSIHAVRLKAQKLKVKIGQSRSINESFFEKWTSEMAYVLGFWYADGCIYDTKVNSIVSFTSKDYDILAKIKDSMSSTHPVAFTKKRSVYRLEIPRKKVVSSIEALGGQKNKTKILTFPYVPKKYVYDFIRGYWDGDGYISLKYRGYPIIGCVGTHDCMSEMQKCLGEGAFFPYREGYFLYCLRYYGEKAQEILSLLYDNASIYMDRKYVLAKKAQGWERKLYR